MKIGIITGMKEELEGLQRPMSCLPQDGPCYTFVGKVDQHTVIGAWAGCGKVAAAMCATMLIEKYRCQILIISGTAGLLKKNSDAQLYVVGSAVQHDYGQAKEETNLELYRPGQLPIGEPLDLEFMADGHLVDKVLMLGNKAGLTCDLARVSTGDVFVSGEKLIETIREATLCNLVDMETAAVAQVAFAYDIPWVGIKAVSDDGDPSQFEKNLQEAARRSTVLTERLIESL